VNIKRISTVEYDAYSCVKIKRQNYQKAKEQLLKPAIRLAIDFHDFEMTYDRYTSVILIIDRFSDYI